jgi:serpin B
MLHGGAKSTTEAEIAQALHFTLPQLPLHPAMNALALELAARSGEADAADGEGFRLSVENSLWGDKTTPLVPGFLDLLAENYGAGLNLVDFVHDSEGARVQINDWVDGATSGKIPELLLDGDVGAGTRLVLTNAIYFKAAWRYPFQPSFTMTGTFHAAGGDVSVPMMRGGSELLYAESPEFQAIELPYQGGKVGMTLVLPAEGKLAQVESALSLTWLKALDASTAPHPVAITMPKFTVMQRYDLAVALQALGMKQAFDPTANFSGLSPETPLFVSKVIHQAFVAVDEKGTEAAAATAVILDGGGVPPTPKAFTLDRPFLFFIRDYPTNAILFTGRVVDPS